MPSFGNLLGETVMDRDGHMSVDLLCSKCLSSATVKSSSLHNV